MDKFLNRATSIRNFWLKTAFAILSFILMVAIVYPFFMEYLFLTDNHTEWSSTQTALSGLSLVLSGIAWKFNTLKDFVSGGSNNIPTEE